MLSDGKVDLFKDGLKNQYIFMIINLYKTCI